MFSSFTISSFVVMFIVFLKIGLMFFGGGYAVIPVMQKELVFNHHFLTMGEFIDGIALSQLTPGPVAILATFAGYRILGFVGAIIGTFAMFLPGTFLMFLISKYYLKIKDSNFMTKILNTVVPVLIGLIVAAALVLGADSVFHNLYNFTVFIVALVLLLRYKVNPAILIFISGVLGIVLGL